MRVEDVRGELQVVHAAGSAWYSAVRRRAERLDVGTGPSSDLVGVVLAPTSTRSISSAMRRISGLPMPRVVSAGVPSRMPLVTNGDCGSSGIVFLLTVIPACVEQLLRRLAGEPLGPQVDQHQVGVGAAGDDGEAALDQRVGQRLGVLDHLPRSRP